MDKCVICGDVIPEGRQVCSSCEHKKCITIDSEYLNYEPVNMITKVIDDIAHKAAENIDTMMIKKCIEVNVDPDALANTMRRVRAQEAEIDRLKALTPPCKIGDTVWAIRNYSGTNKVVPGKVSEMFFREDMSICIVVKHVARGIWGEVVFGTYEQAKAVLEEQDEE